MWLHSFLTQALDGGQWQASCSGHFTPEDRAHTTNCVEGWVGLRAILDFSEQRRISCCCQHCPACSVVTIPNELSQLYLATSTVHISNPSICVVLLHFSSHSGTHSLPFEGTFHYECKIEEKKINVDIDITYIKLYHTTLKSNLLYFFCMSNTVSCCFFTCC